MIKVRRHKKFGHKMQHNWRKDTQLWNIVLTLYWWVWLLAAYRRTHNPGHLAWSEGRRPLGAVPYSS